MSLSFHDETNDDETATWRTVVTGAVQGDRTVVVDFNRAINLPFAFTPYGTCPAPIIGNHLALPVTAGEKRPTRSGLGPKTGQKHSGTRYDSLVGQRGPTGLFLPDFTSRRQTV